MELQQIVGVVSIILFMLLILFVGLFEAWCKRKLHGHEYLLIAGRKLGTFVGLFTMTATWVGGGYINGTAEIVFNNGLIWCQGPIAYALSLIISGRLFAYPMRKANYVTMLDPFQKKYGKFIVIFIIIPAICAEVFWCAAILAALGSTIGVVGDFPTTLSITISATLVTFYTLFGGLLAVAHTDVVQLICIAFGLLLSIPFILHHKATTTSLKSPVFYGEISKIQIVSYLDSFFLLILGAMPWQCYFQRVLASPSATKAMSLSMISGIACFFFAIPSIIIGNVGHQANWKETSFNGTTPTGSLILPLVIKHFVPDIVSWCGLGAITAAVMSSADSSILSAASLLAHNVWKGIIRRKANEKEVTLIIRISVILAGITSAVLANTTNSVYGLWILSADLVYVTLFPQLLSVIYIGSSNIYGAITSLLMSIILRLCFGADVFGIPNLFEEYEKSLKVYFPIKTSIMLSSLLVHFLVSKLSNFLIKFKTGRKFFLLKRTDRSSRYSITYL
ncbi:hypothetical protein SNEBB_000194 [Seison nebaliae]|nr:hypothetical protein SNEBB_000194 [Seison nebaliae]